MNDEQREILTALNTKSQTIYGGAQGDDIKELIRLGHVKQTPVNLSEVLYEITESGRKALEK